MITLILIREDTEKLHNHHILTNKLKPIKRNGIFAYRIISRYTRNSKASNILRIRERVRRSTKIINFPKHTSPSYYSTEKIKKTGDNSENGASLSLSDWQALPIPALDPGFGFRTKFDKFNY